MPDAAKDNHSKQRPTQLARAVNALTAVANAPSTYRVLAVVVLPLWLLTMVPDVPLLQPDSQDYLDFVPYRTAGYPTFLAVAQALGLGLVQVTWVQFAIYWLAIVGLGWALWHATRHRGLAVASAALVALNIESAKYNFSILTESLFFSVIIGICAAIILCIFRFRFYWALLLSTFVGCAVAIRPMGYAFVPLLLLVGLAVRRTVRPPWRVVVACLVLPAVLVILAEGVLFATLQDHARESLLGQRLFAKSAMLSVAGPNPYPPGDARRRVWALLEDEAAKARAIIAHAPDASTKQYLASNYEVFFEFQFADKALSNAAKDTHANVGTVMRDIGLTRIIAAPLAFAGLAWNGYRALWTPFRISHPTSAKRANAYLEHAAPLPLLPPNHILHQPVRPRTLAVIIQPVFMLIWLMTLCLPVGCVIGWLKYGTLTPAWVTAGLFALMVNGYCVLAGTFGVGITRYMFAMWPVMVLSGTVSVYAVWSVWREAWGATSG